MWILILDQDGRLIARHARIQERVQARVHADHLDRALARGAQPEDSAPLAVRAQILVRPRFRRALACGLQRALLEASEPKSARYWGRIPVVRERITDARPTLMALIEHLLAPGPLSAGVVAQVKILVTDGCGPLYRSQCPDNLRERAQHAIEGLERPRS